MVWGVRCRDTRAKEEPRSRQSLEASAAWESDARGGRLARERRIGALAESRILTLGHNNDILRVMHKDETWRFYRGEES